MPRDTFFEELFFVLKYAKNGMTITGLEHIFKETGTAYHRLEITGYIRALGDLGLIRMERRNDLPGQPYLFTPNATIDEVKKIRDGFVEVMEPPTELLTEEDYTRLILARRQNLAKVCPNCGADMVPHGGGLRCIGCGNEVDIGEVE